MVTVKELLSAQYPSDIQVEISIKWHSSTAGIETVFFFNIIIKDMDRGQSTANLLRGTLTSWQGGSVQIL